MAKKIIIAGGGTGGHIFPAIAIANALKNIDADIQLLFVGANGKMEMEKVPKEGYEIVGLDISGMNRSNFLKNLTLPFKLIKSLLKARQVIKTFKPDICLGVGGYASFPVLRVAQFLGIPTVIQEQNSFAGKSNKILAQKARAIFTAYEGMKQFFPIEKIFNMGNPVRANIQNISVTRAEALTFFKLEEDRKTLFVFGGSLGANSINEALAGILTELQREQVQIIWQTGKSYFQQAKEIADQFEHVRVYEFIREMEMAYSAAAVIVSRAGALSIAELCHVGKAVVFVPYPYAAEDHQTHNAKSLVEQHAAIMVPDHEVKSKLLSNLMSIFNNQENQESLSRNIKALARNNADEAIATKILELI